MVRACLLTLLIILLPGIFLSAYGQDKIITSTGDTIHCKIHRETAGTIFFTQSDGVVQSRSQISKNDVQSWQVNKTTYRGFSGISTEDPGEKWRISIAGGVGYRIASTKESKNNMLSMGFSSSEVDSYFRQIKTGVKASGQIHYMFWQNYGLGIDYQFHTSSGNLYGTVDSGDTYTMLYGKFSDDIYTNFVGLSLYMQQWISPKFKFIGVISSGLTLFREESVAIYSPMLLTGKAYGGNTELGLEYFIGKKMAVSLSAGLFQSTISRITVNNGTSTQEIDLPKEQREGLSRVDMNAGLIIFL